MDAQTQLVMDICTAFSTNSTILGLFLDIAGAYDNVQLPILYQKMSALGLPSKFNKRVISFISDRKIYLRINGSLVESKITQLGLPQGGILSPLLYSIYVADIESVLPPNVKIVQYADDICLYVCNKTIIQCQEALDVAMHAVDNWTDENGLTISESKCVVCPFNRCNRVEISQEITLGRHTFPCDTKVRFLGLLLDRKMNWKGHINKIIEKTEKLLNVLRLICHSNWGADPSVALMFYRATIRSIIDYGSVFYGQARKTHLQKLDKIQNKSIRLCLGLLKSTPINVLLGEACELPLHIRRSMLAGKYLVKIRSMECKVLKQISSVAISVLTNPFWTKKVSPPLVDGFIDTSTYQYRIHTAPKPLLFEKSYQLATINISIGSLNSYDLPPALLNIQFQVDIKTRWPNAHLIYTDGSKIGNNVGCAFYDPQTKYFEKFKLLDECTIFTSEILAIRQALRYVKSLTGDLFIIVTDSKSATLKLSNINPKKITNYLIVEILEVYSELVIAGKNVLLLWTAAHKGVEGNEVADRLAKAAAMEGDRLPMKAPVSDIVRLVKENAFKEWQAAYSLCQKGLFHKNIHPVITRKPWFSGISQSRSYFVNMLRIRSNHFVSGSYLHKIGLRDTPLCTDCDEPDDMEHVIMICPRYASQRNAMWKELCRDVPTPFNYGVLLQTINSYAAIHSFLKDTEKQRRREYNFTSENNNAQ